MGGVGPWGDGRFRTGDTEEIEAPTLCWDR